MSTHEELVAAVRSGNADQVTQAITSGASADERDSRGFTVLMMACEKGDIKITNVLLDAGASPNRRTTEREETVLHQLARRPASGDLIRAVLKHKCRLDRVDRFGWTPLMVSAQSGTAEVATALVAAGANTAVQAPDGRTVRDVAEAAGHIHVLAALP
ncbi:MAG: hypothetical protein GWP91_16195 [Rhodobacterales bacterium]|nr:hypothetical protein [Rhodobacterales bacterium]